MVLLPGSGGLAQKRGARPGWEEGLAHTSQLLGSQECRWENNRQWPGDGDRGHCRPPFPRPAVYTGHGEAMRGCRVLGAGYGRAPGPDSLMLSMSSESTTERLCSSPAMARSKAFCFTILLHSWYFILASLSWGFTFTTWAGRRTKRREGGRRGHQSSDRAGVQSGQEAGMPQPPTSCPVLGSGSAEAGPPGIALVAQAWAQFTAGPQFLGPQTRPNRVAPAGVLDTFQQCH